MAKSHEIPEFASEEEFASEDEEREWWASHDTSELPGQDVPFRLTGSPERATRVVAVGTDQSKIDRLKRLAAQRGVDYHEMVRAWIDERLQEEAVSQ
ncbi:MAG: CopG family antitoxin [Chloroflexota bacterium]